MDKPTDLNFEMNIDTKKAIKQIRELKAEIRRLQNPVHGIDWRMVGEVVIAGLIFLVGYILFKAF